MKQKQTRKKANRKQDTPHDKADAEIVLKARPWSPGDAYFNGPKQFSEVAFTDI